MADNEINGVVPVFKPRDWTSFDVVAKLRHILHTRRIGHGGTLDPLAEGVLPVFVGKATRACDMIPDRKKGYYAGFKLGLTTDTQDITGEVIKTGSNAVSRDDLEKAAAHFVGDIMQIPPMYSAVKVDGKKLYELARQGRTIERKARPVCVRQLEVTDYDESAREGHLSVICEKGTYVRTLINDIGEELGCGAVMTSLLRNYSAGFTVEECMTIGEIQEKVTNEGAESVLRAVDICFASYQPLFFDERITKLYKNGVRLRPEQVSAEPGDTGIHRVYGFDSEFLGLGRIVKGEFRSVKNFFTLSEG